MNIITKKVNSGPYMDSTTYTALRNGDAGTSFPANTLCRVTANVIYIDMDGVPITLASLDESEYWNDRCYLNSGDRYTYVSSLEDLTDLDTTSIAGGNPTGNDILYVLNSTYTHINIYTGYGYLCKVIILSTLEHLTAANITIDGSFDAGAQYVAAENSIVYDSGVSSPVNNSTLMTVHTITDPDEWPCANDLESGVIYYMPNAVHGICVDTTSAFLLINSNVYPMVGIQFVNPEYRLDGRYRVYVNTSVLEFDLLRNHDLWWPLDVMDGVELINIYPDSSISIWKHSWVGTAYCSTYRWGNTGSFSTIDSEYVGLENCKDVFGEQILAAIGEKSSDFELCYTEGDLANTWQYYEDTLVLSKTIPVIDTPTMPIVRNISLPVDWAWAGAVIVSMRDGNDELLNPLTVGEHIGKSIIQVDILTNTIKFSKVSDIADETCLYPVVSTTNSWSDYEACSGDWECPGDGADAIWIGTGDDDGNPPDCTGEWKCPGNGAIAVWDPVEAAAPYGTPPDCAGEWVCPGDGGAAVWSNPDVPTYGNPPDCAGHWHCPGDGADAVWSNLNVVPYGIPPDCTGEWVCPAGGWDAYWDPVEAAAPYGTPPDCAGEWVCPGDGGAAVWSNPDVPTYGLPPNCTGEWVCSSGSPIWSNPNIPTYGTVPDCVGSWSCAGDTPVWTGPSSVYLTPPDCSGQWECPGGGISAVPIVEFPDVGPPACQGGWLVPGNGIDPVWNNPNTAPYKTAPVVIGEWVCSGNGNPPTWETDGYIDQYGTRPDCTGDWECPGNGEDAIWVSEEGMAPYGTPPDCTGEWTCPGNGVDPVWSNPNVVPYIPTPDCAGHWYCPGDGVDPVWSNPSVSPYGNPVYCAGEWICPAGGGDAYWVGNVLPYGVEPDCTGDWYCPGDGADAIWIGTGDEYGTPPNCTGEWTCPGNGVDPVWSNPDTPSYGITPNCKGEWVCPGNGADAIWNNPGIPTYGNPPDCIGSWSCPGEGAVAVWSNPKATPYEIEPNCVGAWVCPGNGADPVWNNQDIEPYTIEPDCAGHWYCPGDGADAVWSNPNVTPYEVEPNCVGEWICLEHSAVSTWPNWEVEPYGSMFDCAGKWVCPAGGGDAVWVGDLPTDGTPPTIDVTLVQFTETLSEGGAAVGDYINGMAMDSVINVAHTPALVIEGGCSLTVARQYSAGTEVTCSTTVLGFPDIVIPVGLVLEYSDNSTDGLNGTWTQVGDSADITGVSNTSITCGGTPCPST